MLVNFDRIASDPKKALLLILGISIGIKLVLVVMSDIINPDAVRYINAAHEILRRDFAAAFTHEKMLGFAFLLGLTKLVVADWFLAGKLLSALPLVLTTLPLYLIARDLFGVRAALASAVMFSVLPYANGLVTEVVKGPMFLLCIVTSLWLVMRGLRNETWPELVGAACFALLGMLFRVESMVYLATVMLMLGLFVCVGKGRRAAGLQRLLAFSALPVAVACMGGAVILAGLVPPEILDRAAEHFGHYFTPHLFDNYVRIYQHLDEVERQFSGGQWSNDFFELARYQLPLIYLVGLLQVFVKVLSPVFLLPLLFSFKLKQHRGAALALLLAVIFGFLGMDYLFLVKNNFISGRYLLVPVILSLVLAGYGLDRLLGTLSATGFAKFASVLVLFLCIMVPAVESFAVLADQKIVLKTAGHWLAKHQDLDRLQIITNNEQVVFYAGLMRRSYQVFPPAPAGGYEAEALQREGDLVILVFSATQYGQLPAFRQFRPLAEFADKRKKIVIYERIK